MSGSGVADRRTFNIQDNSRYYRDSNHPEFNNNTFNSPVNFYAKESEGPRILEWISEVPYMEHHHRINDDRMDGTCEWILSRNAFKKWRRHDTEDERLLFLTGIPGSGKTYIASKVIETISQSPEPNEKVAYFYCNREADRSDPNKILCTIISQLARNENGKIPQPVVDLYTARKGSGQLSSKLSLKECEKLLIELISLQPAEQTVHRARITICIDALDEINNKKERLDLLQSLKTVMQHHYDGNIVKIFATMRMDVNVFNQLRNFPRIELAPNDNFNDIQHFIKFQVKRGAENGYFNCVVVNQKLQDDICKDLGAKAKGMFQLAALQITILYDAYTKDDLIRSLKVSPQTLYEAYQEIFTRIITNTGDAPKLALNAFRWIQCSYEPLDSAALLDAIRIQPDGSRLSVIDVYGLLGACQNLIIYDRSLDMFRFAHLSMSEYLQQKLSVFDSHVYAAKVCMSFLCDSDYERQYRMHAPWSIKTKQGAHKDRHLLLYSTVFWPWHISKCEGAVNDSLEAFLSTPNNHFQLWITYHQIAVRLPDPHICDPFWRRVGHFGSFLWAFPRDGNPAIAAACMFGLAGVCEKLKLLAKLDMSNQALVWRLIRTACIMGDHKIIQQLADHGANFHGQNTFGDTLLHETMRNGNEKAAELLITRGVDVSSKNTAKQTPLHRAAYCCDENMVRLLIRHKADITAVDNNRRTPLHNAIIRKSTAVAKLLIDRDADVSARDNSEQSPLHYAVTNDEDELVRKLVSS
ncbi:hypothetical protein EDC01DRAFT_693331, partial [Geopyxis carbonaria]